MFAFFGFILACGTAPTHRPDLNWKKSAQGMMFPELQVMRLVVQNTSNYHAESTSDPPTPLDVQYPRYLQDLQYQKPDKKWKIRHSCQYLFDDRPVKSIDLGDVLEIRISEHQHPLHFHVNPMQVMIADHHIGNFWPGDWYDTFHGKGVIRLRPTDFEGPRIFHCHWFAHADLGCMGILQVGDQNLTNDIIYLTAKEEIRIRNSSPQRDYTQVEQLLESPKEISFRDFPDFNVETDLFLDSWLYEGPYSQFWTRTINGGIPGPTIRVKRGHNLTLHYHNLLQGGNETRAYERNQFGLPNTTNLHFHGLHVRPDYTTKTRIQPGMRTTYHIHIPEDHLPGTHWYHPHFHGSSALQATGGAHGIIIVEDDIGSLPKWLANAKEQVIVLSSIPQTIDSLKWLEAQSRGNLKVHEYDKEFLLVNGQVKPTLKLELGHWYRWRMLFVSLNRHTKLTLPKECESYLLATDGYLIALQTQK